MSTSSNDFAMQGQDFADNAADKLQGGIRHARQTATQLGETAADQAQTFIGRGIDTARATAQQVRDSATQASESLVSYTKENPLKAILLAAASGAILVTLIKALSRSRD